LSLTTTATTFSAPGDYPITASGATAANYSITFAGGTLQLAPGLASLSGSVSFTLGSTQEPLAGRVVFLDLQGDGTLDPGDPSILTGPDGSYSFANLPVAPDVGAPSAYTVRLASYPTDTVLSPAGGAAAVPLSSGVAARLDFALMPLVPTLPVNSPSPAQDPATGTDPNLGFVQALYQSVLGRALRPIDEAFALGFLDGGGTRSGLSDIVYRSAEHRAMQIEGYFQTDLGVNADPGSVSYWVNQFLAGASDESVVEAFLTSPAYAGLHPSTQGFVQALYHDVLGREGEDAGVSFYVGELDSGVSRAVVAGSFLHSEEAYQDALAGYFGALLGRAPVAAEANLWQASFQREGGYAALLEGLLDSSEFSLDAGA
jgi:hypothetical protein